VSGCDSPHQSRTAVLAAAIQQIVFVPDLSLVADLFLGLINAQNSPISVFPSSHIKNILPTKS
jgi:hypothetical protein